MGEGDGWVCFSALLVFYYSFLRTSTGFEVADLIAWRLMVRSAIANANKLHEDRISIPSSI